jgi:hypothetical protein
VKRFQKRRQRAATPFGQPRLSSTLNIPDQPRSAGEVPDRLPAARLRAGHRAPTSLLKDVSV